MKHEGILARLLSAGQNDPNVDGFFVFGSVATGTQRADSDLDVISVLHANTPSSGIRNTTLDGIKVGEIFFTFDVLAASVDAVPYLLHPLAKAKLLFDRNQTIEPLLGRIRAYFAENPDVVEQWDRYYARLADEKSKFGYEKTTIIDVWNEMERRRPRGGPKRPFFNAFYMTNPLIFSMLKRLM